MERGGYVNPRNFLKRGSLQDNMEEWTGNPSLQLQGLEGVALPRQETSATVTRSVSREEVALIARARAGDQDAFGVLVRLHQGAVYQLTLRMLRDPEEACEATQEVFLAAWQGLHGFREEARFATWLYRIAYNYCLKATEKRKRDESARAELVATSAREQRPANVMSAQLAQDAERDMRELVRVEIANLPTKYRAALVLRHLQDLSYEEMAEVMRVPIGTVKTHLFRARALLKERLQDLERARDEGLARAEELRLELETNLRTMLEHGREATGRGGGQ